MNNIEFGDRLRAARKQAGLTQVEAAQWLGIPQPRISQYERGHRLPTILRLREIILRLKLDPSIIFPEFFSCKK